MNKTLIAAVLMAVSTVANAKLTPNEEAYVKAAYNINRAACLVDAVERKLNYDVITRTVHDFGNVITAPVCAAYTYTEFVKQRAEYTKTDPKLIATWEKGIKKLVKEKEAELKKIGG